MSKRTIVFGTTREVARWKLNSLFGDMRCVDVGAVRDDRHKMLIRLNNGDIYETAAANDSSRGKRCDYAYVDRNIEIETLNTIILPCILRNEDSNEENLFFY